MTGNEKADRNLQFGHGCDAVETVAAAATFTFRFCFLQFGHGCDAVETLAERWLNAAPPPLQFGHGCDAVETAARTGRTSTRCSTFNSATAVMPWKRGCGGAGRNRVWPSIRPRL